MVLLDFILVVMFLYGLMKLLEWSIENERRIQENVQREQEANAQVSTIPRSSRQIAVYGNITDLLSVPSHWSPIYYDYEVYEENISPWSVEGAPVWNDFLSSFSCANITGITRVQNPFLYYRYQLRKEEYQARHMPYMEQTLLHATGKSKVSSILRDNLDWRRVRRSKFGKGVSFSPDAKYANTQSSRSNGSYRAIIIAKVLVGRSHYGSDMKLPKDGYDTTTGNGNKVVVKYYDDEFYPEYVVYYNL